MTERHRLKKLLRDLDIEQRDFAAELGVDPTHFCHVLAGRRPFSRQLAQGTRNLLKLRGHEIDVEALRAEARLLAASVSSLDRQGHQAGGAALPAGRFDSVGGV